MEASADQIAGSLGEGFRDLTGAMNAGFEQLSYGMEDISAGIAELNATFHWGFGEVMAVLGHMNDALSELIKIAKTPVQTVAFNHFEIARDAFRQSLYRECLEELDKAIDIDRFYALKAARDGDFQSHDAELRGFLEALSREKYRQSALKVRETLEKLALLLDYSTDARNSPAMMRINAFLKNGESQPLVDMLGVVQGLDKDIAEIRSDPLVMTLNSAESKRTREEAYPVEETYQEEVIIKKGGLFKKAVTEMQTRKRTVMKTRKAVETFPGKEIKMEFCPVEPGRIQVFVLAMMKMN